MKLVAVNDDITVPITADAVERHQLALFDTWATELVERIDPAHRHTITSYLRWGQHRRLARAVATDTLSTWSTLAARQQTTQAVALLDWLAGHRVTLSELDQPLLERWLTGGTTTRQQHSSDFLRWAQRQRLVGRHLRIPRQSRATATALPVIEHNQIIARLVDDTTISTPDRVAGLLVTLYAQPASRIIHLRHAHLHSTPGGIAIELGNHPIEPVAPLAALLMPLLQSGADLDAWLFPGETAGQPLSAKTLGQRLLRHGISRAARVAALHHLIATVPAPVLADLIGYNPNFIAEQAAKLGVPWAHYAALRART